MAKEILELSAQLAGNETTIKTLEEQLRTLNKEISRQR
jgi:uncharacterized coiled-coil protein SlyX